MSDDELYPYSVGRLTMNFIYIPSDVLRRIISVFFGRFSLHVVDFSAISPCHFSRLFLGYFSMDIVDIAFSAFRSIISLSLASGAELSNCIF